MTILLLAINITPSGRYVLSVPQSYQFRLRADGSRWDNRPRGFNNLYLTGDWIDNSFNSGCIEATTMAGMQGQGNSATAVQPGISSPANYWRE